jgi:hypothetical protein
VHGEEQFLVDVPDLAHGYGFIVVDFYIWSSTRRTRGQPIVRSVGPGFEWRSLTCTPFLELTRSILNTTAWETERHRALVCGGNVSEQEAGLWWCLVNEEGFFRGNALHSCADAPHHHYSHSLRAVRRCSATKDRHEQIRKRCPVYGAVKTFFDKDQLY